MVSSIIDDMRSKIIASQIGPENDSGCCFGEVDEYLDSFEAAIEKMKSKFTENRQ